MYDQQRIIREEVRGHILKAIDRHRPEATGIGLINRGLTHLGIRLQDDELVGHLKYLADKDILSSANRGADWSLTPYGVDVVEGSVERPPGIPEMSMLSHAEVQRRCEIRWRILTVLDITRTTGSLGETVQNCLSDVDFVVSDKELNREMDYLSAKNLVLWKGDTASLEWSAYLTVEGADVVDYENDAPAGLARPKKFWEG